MNIDTLTDMVSHQLRRYCNKPPYPDDFIVKNIDGYLNVFAVINQNETLLGKIKIEFFEKTHNTREALNIYAWIKDCSDIYYDENRFGKETVKTYGEGYETIANWEKRMFGELSKTGEAGFKIIRLTEGYKTVVVAGGGKLYIHHRQLYKEGKRPFFYEMNEDNYDNRYMQSKFNDRTCPENDIDLPTEIFTSVYKAQIWVNRMYLDNKIPYSRED